MMRLKCCKAGSIILKIFLALACCFSLIYLYDLFSPTFGFSQWRNNKTLFIIGIISVILFCSLVFWVGIILVYTCCNQLRLKKRVLGIALAWIPVINIIMLLDIIITADKEYSFEKAKYQLDVLRKKQKICLTKYPVLLVHGVFFRDFKHLNYWGRIPKELEKNGAVIYYGNHNSASSVPESAEQLKKRIYEITEESGCEKINIIAHSKGGLDVRYMLSDSAAARYVASVTTINTPHRGCKFADYLFEKVPETFKNFLANAYNVQKRASSGRFPLNLTNRFVKYFDGDNDGLVGTDSFEWGTKFKLLVSQGRRGISHADMIDLNRENIKGFDVREFYVQLVSDLKKAGY